MTRPNGACGTNRRTTAPRRPRWWGSSRFRWVTPAAGGSARWRSKRAASETSGAYPGRRWASHTDTHCSFERDGGGSRCRSRRRVDALCGGRLERVRWNCGRCFRIARWSPSPSTRSTILPRQKLTIYVGSPLWVGLLADDPLGELPLQPPKLTWWGTNTREGEVCYASRTQGRLRRRGGRAATRTGC